MADLDFRPAPPEDAIAVATEAELRAALAGAALDWGDARVLQLTADIELTATLVISSPVRLQGNCVGGDAGPGGRRCVLRGRRLPAQLHRLRPPLQTLLTMKIFFCEAQSTSTPSTTGGSDVLRRSWWQHRGRARLPHWKLLV